MNEQSKIIGVNKSIKNITLIKCERKWNNKINVRIFIIEYGWKKIYEKNCILLGHVLRKITWNFVP